MAKFILISGTDEVQTLITIVALIVLIFFQLSKNLWIYYWKILMTRIKKYKNEGNFSKKNKIKRILLYFYIFGGSVQKLYTYI